MTGWPADAEPGRSARAALIAGSAGAAVAAIGIAIAASAGGPYLSFGALNPGIVVFALGLFALLIAAPFALHARVSARVADRDKRWELALLQWGAIALAAGGAFAIVGIASGFGSDSLGGAIAIVGIAECCLVIAALAVLILGGG